MTAPSEPTAANAREQHMLALMVGGNPEGLRQLLQEYGGLIRARLVKDFGRALDHSELDEAMSSMAVRVWGTANRFDPTKGTLRAWAMVIARNCALRLLEYRRRSMMRSEPDLDHLSAAIDVGVGSTADRQRLRADLYACIEQLPQLQRSVLLADLDAGVPVAAGALAERLGTTANSIYVSRLKGRRAVCRSMQALGHEFVESRQRKATIPGPMRPHLIPSRSEHA